MKLYYQQQDIGFRHLYTHATWLKRFPKAEK